VGEAPMLRIVNWVWQIFCFGFLLLEGL